MSSTGGKPSENKLEPLALSMDQLVRPKKQITPPINTSIKDSYSIKLKKERSKLIHDELAFADFATSSTPTSPVLGLQRHEMVRPTASYENNLKGIFNSKELSNGFNNSLTALHPFGKPSMGWAPKEQLMSLIRLIDQNKRNTYTGRGNGHV